MAQGTDAAMHARVGPREGIFLGRNRSFEVQPDCTLSVVHIESKPVSPVTRDGYNSAPSAPVECY